MEDIVRWAACGLFAASVGCDLRWRRIPNVIPGALLVLFAIHALAGGAGPPAILWLHAAVGAALLAAGFALWLAGGFGAGDGKLIAVAGLWVGPADLGLYLMGLAAGAFALSLFAVLPLAGSRRLRQELPFAVAIAPPAVVIMAPHVLWGGVPL